MLDLIPNEAFISTELKAPLKFIYSIPFLVNETLLLPKLSKELHKTCGMVNSTVDAKPVLKIWKTSKTSPTPKEI